MDAEYLRVTVGSVLSRGLASTVLTSPSDPVDYLAHWLRNHVTTEQKKRKEDEELAKLRASDQARALERQQSLSLLSESSSLKSAAAIQQTRSVESFINGAKSLENLFPELCDVLQSYTGFQSVYIAEYEKDRDGDGLDGLHYIAASKKDQNIINKRINKENSVTVTELFADGDELEGEADDESESESPLVRPPRDPRSLFIPNVLLGKFASKIHFHRKIPRLGSYLAVKLSFPSVFNEVSLDEGIEKEKEIAEQKREEEENTAKEEEEAEERRTREEEEDAEAASDDEEAKERADRRAAERAAAAEKANQPPPSEEERARAEEDYLLTKIKKIPKHFVLCVDSLGQNRRMTENEVKEIIRLSHLILNSLQRLDRSAFTAERFRRADLISASKDFQSQLDAKSDEERNEDNEKLKDELESAGEAHTESDIALKYNRELILAQKTTIADWKHLELFRGPCIILQAFLYCLGYEPNQVIDADGKAEWKKIRSLIDEKFFQKISSIHPRLETGKPPAHATHKAIEKLIEGVDSEELKERNSFLQLFLGFVQAFIGVRRALKEELKAAEEAERARKEEEERLKGEEEENKLREEEEEEPAEEEEEDQE
jgi:hypothetical protein